MTPEIAQELVVRSLALLVLAAFIWLYSVDLVAAFRKPLPFSADRAAAQTTDPRTYVTTAVAALVGGVSAVFLGVQAAEGESLVAAWTWADSIRVAYVVVWGLFGAAAIAAWVKTGSGTSLSIKNLAVTFIGLVSPAVATYLGSS